MEKMFLENNNVIFFNSYYIFLGLDHFWMLEKKQFQSSMVLILGSCKKKYKICMQITSMFIYEEYLYNSILRFPFAPFVRHVQGFGSGQTLTGSGSDLSGQTGSGSRPLSY